MQIREAQRFPRIMNKEEMKLEQEIRTEAGLRVEVPMQAPAGQDAQMPMEGLPEEVLPEEALPVGPERLLEFTRILQRYKAGKARTEQRITASEQWWKLRNTAQEQKDTGIGADGGFTAASGWLHNVIVSKHADAMQSYPEPSILPRESADVQEARQLSAIIPCILEQNQFESTYSDAMWQKLKTGTACYKVVWDQSRLNGLGDIAVERVNLLNIYWEPGVTDIQKSRYFFHTESCDRELLEQRYPRLKGRLKGQSFVSTQFLYDDTVPTEDKHTVIEVYYHKEVGGKNTLQYCKFVGDQVLFATENELQPAMEQGVAKPPMALTGLYDHGKFPYVFDALYPIEGSPCGYGFVDLCRNPQTVIDLLNTAFVKNAMVGATPRYFRRQDGGVNAAQFLDLNNPLVDVAGSLDENALRRIEHTALDANYIAVLDRTIQELRQTSGNTDTSTGNISSGVTAASAIAALQEASGKGSRDSTQASYRAYSRIVELCIELVRQFYSLPRQFRITGQYGVQQFVSYTNKGLQQQHQGNDFGQDMGYRLPVFDIKVSAQKQNVYTRVSQNEMALQFFKLGFFNPQLADQTLQCLQMMDFDGRDTLMQGIARNAALYQKLRQYMELSLALAQQVSPGSAQAIARDMAETLGAAAPGGGDICVGSGEDARVEQARRQAGEAAQPGSPA